MSELVNSLKEKRYFPVPRKNPLYGITNSKNFLLPIKLCIVGVITTDDDNFIPAIEVLGHYRYRLPHIMETSKNEINVTQPQNYFDNIGGNEETKRALEDVLAIDKNKRAILKKIGLSIPTGVLLYGPPGTGKTLLAKAVSRLMSASVTGEENGSFFSIKASDIVSSEIGESEKMLSTTFETARQKGPSVIFIDEFQALFTSRDNQNGVGKGGSSRLASTLLSLMDDVTKWRNANTTVDQTTTTGLFAANRVVILAATNTPWMVDRAFLRAGRFDRVSKMDARI